VSVGILALSEQVRASTCAKRGGSTWREDRTLAVLARLSLLPAGLHAKKMLYIWS